MKIISSVTTIQTVSPRLDGPDLLMSQVALFDGKSKLLVQFDEVQMEGIPNLCRVSKGLIRVNGIGSPEDDTPTGIIKFCVYVHPLNEQSAYIFRCVPLYKATGANRIVQLL